MRRVAAILGSLCFILLAPGVVAGLCRGGFHIWQIKAPLLGIAGFRVIGATLIDLGVPMLLDSFARFASQGLGMPAPVFPTRHLVATGLYRHVRNPMYVGVIAVIVGQGRRCWSMGLWCGWRSICLC